MQEQRDIFGNSDTFISKLSPDKNEADEKFLRAGGLKTGQSDDEKRILLKFQIPDITLETIEDIQLCLYQFHPSESENNKFVVSLIEGEWDRENVTWRTQPTIGASFTPFRPKPNTVGKFCINVWSPSFSYSYALRLEGKRGCFFYSSRYTSAPNGIDEESSSNIYHPHLVITSTELEPLELLKPLEPSSSTISISPSNYPAVSPPRNIPTNLEAAPPDKQKASSPYVTLTIGFATGVAIVTILGAIYFFWRKRKNYTIREYKHSRMRDDILPGLSKKTGRNSNIKRRSPNKDFDANIPSSILIRPQTLDSSEDAKMCNPCSSGKSDFGFSWVQE